MIRNIENKLFCDEINISVEQFRNEIINDLYEFPKILKEHLWNEKQKQEYINSLKKNYPLIPIIIDRKPNGDRVILDGAQRMSAISEHYEFFEDATIKVYELRGNSQKKLELLRTHNKVGREKSEIEMRELIYGHSQIYKQIPPIENKMKIQNLNVDMTFILKILSRAFKRDILKEDSDLIDFYLEKKCNDFLGDQKLYKSDENYYLYSLNNEKDSHNRFSKTEPSSFHSDEENSYLFHSTEEKPYLFHFNEIDALRNYLSFNNITNMSLIEIEREYYTYYEEYFNEIL